MAPNFSKRMEFLPRTCYITRDVDPYKTNADDTIWYTENRKVYVHSIYVPSTADRTSPSNIRCVPIVRLFLLTYSDIHRPIDRELSSKLQERSFLQFKVILSISRYENATICHSVATRQQTAMWLFARSFEIFEFYRPFN